MVTLNKIFDKDVYICKIEGKVDKKGIEKFYELLEAKADTNSRLNLLLEVDEIPGFENFEAFTQTLKVKFKSIKAMGKYAILSDQNLIKRALPVGNFMIPGIPMKHFEPGQREEAIEWLENINMTTDDNKIELIEDGIYSYTVDGKFNKGGLRAIKYLLEGDEKIKLLFILKHFDGFDSFKTFIDGVKLDLKAIGKVEKYAFLSDIEWVKKMVEVEDFIIPGMEIKTYSLNEQEEALEWLRIEEVEEVDPEEYLTSMNFEKIDDDIFCFTVDGKIDTAGMKALKELFEENAVDQKISLIAIIKDFNGFESFASLIEGFKVDLKVIGNIEKYAVLSDSKWLKKIIKIESFILPGMDMKGFDLNEKEEAIVWIRG